MPLTIDPDERREIARRVKVELRDRMKRVRRALGPENRAARSAKIAERVAAMPEWTRATTVALFVPMRMEVDVGLLERRARTEGKRVAAPRMTPPEDGAPIHAWRLVLHEWADGAELIESGHMVREVAATAPIVPHDTVDLVIVPALALDVRGARIGYGAGHYDALLPTCTRATRVGVAFDFQLLAEIPEEEGDARVHWIVTDDRAIEADRDRAP
jgi:5-formyltetrahydrofolate cyclo-ligase